MTYNPRSRPNHHPAANSAGCQRVVPPTPNTGKDAMRDCQADGHILVDDDRACLSCDQIVTTDDKIAVHYQRKAGELLTQADVADPQEWGPAG